MAPDIRLARVSAVSGTFCALSVLVPVAASFTSPSSSEEGALDLYLLVIVTARSLLAGTLVATLATLAGWIIARSVPATLVIAAALVAPLARSLGWLSLGLRPGLIAFSVTHLTILAPFAAVIIMLRSTTLPAQPLQAARELGATRALRRRMIVWPHLRPALLLAFLWSLLQVVGDVVVADLAGGGKVYGPAVLARDALLRDDAPARARVVVIALMLLALVLSQRLGRELDDFDTHSDLRCETAIADMDARLAGWGVFALTMAPVLALVPGAIALTPTMSSSPLTELLPITLALALALGISLGALGFWVAGAQAELRYHAGTARSWTPSIWLLVPLVVPASVLGSAWLSAAPVLMLRPGILLTTIALSGPLVSIATLAARLRLRAVSKIEWDAARDLGAGLGDRTVHIWRPAAAPAFAAIAALGAAWVVAQDAIPSFTAGPGGTTLAMGLLATARRGDVATLDRWVLGLAVLPMVALLLAWRWRASTRSPKLPSSRPPSHGGELP